MTDINDIVEATPVENVAEVVNDVPPVPETVEYGVKVKLLPKFKRDAVAVLSEFAYVETHELIKVIDGNDELPINVVNEVVRRISSFPYRAVAPVMRVIETEQNQYFEIVNPVDTDNK